MFESMLIQIEVKYLPFTIEIITLKPIGLNK